MAAAEVPPAGEKPWPAPVLAWTALIILAIANILSYLDRIIINLLVEPIQADLAINDTQFSLLQGLAFGLFYTLLALPIGRRVDSQSRKPIIAIGVAVFSLFSLLSGFAKTFGQLFLARVGVGAGEASVTPTAYSLISDYFPPERLGRAMSIFTMTAFVGIGLAYMAGGAAIAAIAAWDAPGLIDDLEPWRRVFVVISIPGLFIIPLLLMLKEPERRGRKSEKMLPVKQVFSHIWRQGKGFALLLAGFSMITMSGYASTVWTPALFIRVFDWTAPEIGFAYGALYLVLGPAGAILAGTICDKMTAKGFKDAPLRVAAFGFVGTGLFGGIAPLLPNGTLALSCFAPTMIMSTMPYPMAATAIQLITPNELRGQVTAFYLLIINVIGLGLGPIVVGLFSDFAFPQPDGVRYSLAIVNAACAPVALFFLVGAFRPYAKLRNSA
ncbi:Predicted arabinose efflux permease, MFS family [Parasphingorhabdus marina DSM 22363]|uniref:Predicted arabinose efflux permease, MFS family n=1 Tax=Parasphingorhabdus marina DSM 22363 TaxID=1123272 RepID=A0A1N6D4E1_9SPHN|nr:MFS transporter [Parasphingorhabdus marina]SIN65576.1 Predicted arabinose efflux permease, MFS family [Parasphingorhabdus marina DSM 22363]